VQFYELHRAPSKEGTYLGKEIREGFSEAVTFKGRLLGSQGNMKHKTMVARWKPTKVPEGRK
jgi:hypothetical protein